MFFQEIRRDVIKQRALYDSTLTICTWVEQTFSTSFNKAKKHKNNNKQKSPPPKKNMLNVTGYVGTRFE